MNYQESSIVLTVFRIMQQSIDNRHLIFGQSHHVDFIFDNINNRTKNPEDGSHRKKLMNKQKRLIVFKS